MPDWLVPLLQQFPIVGLVFGILVWVIRWLSAKHRDEIAGVRAEAAEARRRADAEIARARQDLSRALRRHAADVARLEKRHERELATARRRIRELERRGRWEGGR